MRRALRIFLARAIVCAIVLSLCPSLVALAEASIYAVIWDDSGTRTQLSPEAIVPLDAPRIGFGAHAPALERAMIRVDHRLTYSAQTREGVLEMDPEDLLAFGMTRAGEHTVELLNEAGEVMAEATFLIAEPTAAPSAAAGEATPLPAATGSPTPTPTPVPPLGALTVWLEGAPAEEGHVYICEQATIKAWADNASEYHLTVADLSGTAFVDKDMAGDEDQRVSLSRLSQGESCQVTVTAAGMSGEISRITLYLQRPAPTPAPMTAPAIFIDGTAAEGYIELDPEPAEHTFSWSAEGAEYYTVTICASDDPEDSLLSISQTTDTSIRLAADKITRERRYTLLVSAMPRFGREEDVQTARAEFLLPVPPVASLDDLALSLDYSGTPSDLELLSAGQHAITWHTEGAAKYEAALTGPSGDIRDLSASQSEVFTFNTGDMVRDEPYTFALRILPKNGAEWVEARSFQLVYPAEAGEIEVQIDGEGVDPGDTLPLLSDRCQITWTSENAAAYALTPPEGGEEIPLDEGRFDLDVQGMDYDTPCTLTLWAITRYGRRTSTTLKLLRPAPMGEVAAQVEGALEEHGEWAVVGDCTVNWTAEGGNRYGYTLTNDEGEVMASEAEMAAGRLTLNADQLVPETRCTLQMTAESEYGVQAPEAELTLFCPALPEAIEVAVDGAAVEGNEYLVYDPGDHLLTWRADHADSFGYALGGRDTEGLGDGEYRFSLSYGASIEMTLQAASHYGRQIERLLRIACPAPTPGPLGEITLTVDEAVAVYDGYELSVGDHALMWYAEGAASYRVSLTGPDGSVVKPAFYAAGNDELARIPLAFSAESYPPGEYTLTVEAFPEYGGAEDGVAKSFTFINPNAFPLGNLTVTLDGEAYGEGMTLAPGDHAILWRAENAAAYDVEIRLDGAVVYRVEDTSETRCALAVPASGSPQRVEIDIAAHPRYPEADEPRATAIAAVVPTPTPTPTLALTATPAPTATPEPAYVPAFAPLPASSGDARVYAPGRIVTFGRDGYGAPLNWQVLKVESGRALLYSTDVLTRLPYSYDETDTPRWASSPIRQHLEGLIDYFTGVDQGRVLEDPSDYGRGPLFLLTSQEAEALLARDERRSTEKRWLYSTNGTANGQNLTFEYLDESGAVVKKDRTSGADLYGVQPAMWVRVDDVVATAVALTGEARPGDYVQFGEIAYEPLEWLVLASDGTRKVLLSRYILDALPYDEAGGTDTSWAGCSLRAYLNSDFMRTFSANQQSCIVRVKLDNAIGGDTEDDIWILSEAEFRTCFAARSGATTPIDERLYSAKNLDSYNGWWLRDVLATDSGIQAAFFDHSFEDDQVFTADPTHPNGTDPHQLGVRPVICVDTARMK